MNDLRFDLRGERGASPLEVEGGICYIVDSSDEGRNGFIILNLATGESWRRLTGHPSVLRVYDNVPSYLGQPFYRRSKGESTGYLQEGLDGMQLSPDGSRIYYSPLTSSELYSIPTRNLLVTPSQDAADGSIAELAAAANISHHGQRGGFANGFEGDDQGRVYQLMPEFNAIYYFDPLSLTTKTFIRDQRILWPDSASIGQDGYFYVNINQLFFQPTWNNGTDGRQKPGAVLRAKLPNGAGKITGVY
jgi:sugar lactone lactonase YvrE